MKKKSLAEFFCIFECLLTQNIKIHNSFDFSRLYRRLLGNSKTWGFSELFLPENDFETCSTANSTKQPYLYLAYISNKYDI